MHLRAFLFVLGTTLTLLGLGCQRSPRTQDPRTLSLALESAIQGFDPARANDIPTVRVLAASYETLLAYDPKKRPLKVVPDLAASLPKVSEDGLTWTFPIRPGVKYHPNPCLGGPEATRTVEAKDFVFALKRCADPKLASGGWWVLQDAIVGLDAWREAGADSKAPVEGLQAPDPQTLVLKLTRPFPQLRYMLTMVVFAPVPSECAEAHKNELQEVDLGTGPYVLKQRIPKSRIVLTKSPSYRHAPERPWFETIDYRIFVEKGPAWLSFQRGDLAFLPVPKDSLREVLDPQGKPWPQLLATGKKVHLYPSPTLYWIGFNLEHETFQGPKGFHFRKALALAHDPERMAKLVFSGLATPSSVLLPPDLPGFPSGGLKNPLAFDPTQARAELEKAGYPEGRGAPEVVLETRDESPEERQAAEYLAREWKALGLKVSLQVNTYPRYLARTKQGQAQVFLGRWVGDYPDEENWTQLFYGPNRASGTNLSKFQDPRYDELHEQVRTSQDSPERREAIREMMQILNDAIPLRVSLRKSQAVLAQPWLEGFHPNDSIYDFHEHLSRRQP